ncbi:MAG: glycosyltransferase [Pedobacter sp.]|nr:MAG: glycosyltransferase [Pedobacter sp.]
MNILLVSGPGISLKEPYNSGIEAFMVSFANQLVEEGHAVDVVAEKAEDGCKFKLINPFLSSSDSSTDCFDPLKEKDQFRNLDVDSYDVIHYNMFYPHLLNAGLSFHKSSFLTLHSPADKKRIAAYRKLSLLNNITFVAISERIKKQWDLALGIDIPLINNGINMELWPSNGSGKRDYLLWAARINEEKNVVAAINVAKHLQLPLKIAGRIADQHYFDEQVKPHLNSEIQYVGHVTQRELSRLAESASAYLATATWQEPFGLAALEMLASGVPVVGFNTAVPPEWEHESILTTTSLRWQDLIALVAKSAGISSATCKEFALNMNIENMTSNYVKLYRKVLLQEGIIEEGIIEEGATLEKSVKQLVAEQSEIVK